MKRMWWQALNRGLALSGLLCMAVAGCTARADRARHAAADEIATPDFARHFGDITGTFVLMDVAAARVWRHDPARARERFNPASTFKIANTLIALETGVATGPAHALAWDSVRVPREPWWPAAWAADHTLSSALPGSVVWYYQELARNIGAQRMQAYLQRFEYGNADISGGIDRFWLDGGLRISAEEQVAFLRRFYFGELGVSANTTQSAKQLLVLQETPEYRLSGKTGWVGLGGDGRQVGWLVGYLERGTGVHIFAMNMDIRSSEDAAARVRIVRGVLTALGLM